MKSYAKLSLMMAFTIGLILNSGCKKQLDLKPKDTLSDVIFYKTPADFKLAANSLYNSLEGFNFSDTETDIAFNTANAVSSGDYLPSETSSTWTDAYYYIRNANNIISKGVGLTDVGIKAYIAEARFFRAYNYWLLFRLYGGVPLITRGMDVDDPELYTARASRKETVDFILRDLNEAVPDLPLRSKVVSGDMGRITSGAAYALMARVALFEGTWQKYRGQNGTDYLNTAITAATTIMGSKEYDLFTGKGAQSYRYLFIEEGDDSRECVLDRRHEVNISGQQYPYSVVGTVCYLPTRKLADMYLCKDGLPITKSLQFNGYNTVSSEYDNRDPRMTMTMVIPGTAIIEVFNPLVPVVNWPNSPQRNGNTGYITYKYLSENVFGNTNNGDNFGYDRHIIRYAEVLLIYAEAMFEKNGVISDQDLDKSVNLVRNRVNMPALTNTFVTTNGLDMKTELRRERNVEFALEGFRYDDIRRWKTAETEMLQDIRGIKIKGTEWQNIAPYNGVSYQSRTDASGFLIAQPASTRKFDPEKHYLRPLPTREIALYKGKLIQNPNW
uniref:RagB/SusD family nutrient uptake outer membrane protein n=1 Tax=Pedobacter schmidteae TaxID=2201271 RepID=UPI0013CE7920|nr:RagB/SusD family nutrient uptake outer membrane protein [Pedobacter schmidteae]